jgi:hypothetical protein
VTSLGFDFAPKEKLIQVGSADGIKQEQREIAPAVVTDPSVTTDQDPPSDTTG